jgi:uncharacterized protein
MLPQEDTTAKEPIPGLLVDAMLGRLARRLRLLGYDAAYWRDGSDAALVKRARAEGRLIVTRDHQLAGRRGVRALLIASETLEEQVTQIREALGSPLLPLTRCSECNGELADLPRELAQGLVPTYVWHTQAAFRRCPDCGRIYWKGTHWPGMRARLESEEE